MKYRRISWYSTEEMGAYTLKFPWWISGYRCSDDASVIVAAIPLGRKEAIEAVLSAYDKRPGIVEWRFNNEHEGEPWSAYQVSDVGRGPEAWALSRGAWNKRAAPSVTLALAERAVVEAAERAWLSEGAALDKAKLDLHNAVVRLDRLKTKGEAAK